MLVFVLLACSDYGIYAPGKDATTALDTATTPSSSTETVPVEDTGTPPVPTGDTGTEPVADAPVYAHTSTDLYEVEPETGARVYLGSFTEIGQPLEGMVDIAIDLTGRMYGGTDDAIFQIDPTNASLARLCDIPGLRPYALAFTSAGTLYAGAGNEIVQIDLTSCTTSPLLVSSTWETSGDLVGLPDGFLYWTVRGTDADELVRVDVVTGGSFWVGQVAEDRLYGLGYDQGQLYGFSSDGHIVRIDPTDASSQVLSTDPATSWWGATTNPVLWP